MKKGTGSKASSAPSASPHLARTVPVLTPSAKYTLLPHASHVSPPPPNGDPTFARGLGSRPRASSCSGVGVERGRGRGEREEKLGRMVVVVVVIWGEDELGPEGGAGKEAGAEKTSFGVDPPAVESEPSAAPASPLAVYRGITKSSYDPTGPEGAPPPRPAGLGAGRGGNGRLVSPLALACDEGFGAAGGAGGGEVRVRAGEGDGEGRTLPDLRSACGSSALAAHNSLPGFKRTLRPEYGRMTSLAPRLILSYQRASFPSQRWADLLIMLDHLYRAEHLAAMLAFQTWFVVDLSRRTGQ